MTGSRCRPQEIWQKHKHTHTCTHIHTHTVIYKARVEKIKFLPHVESLIDVKNRVNILAHTHTHIDNFIEMLFPTSAHCLSPVPSSLPYIMSTQSSSNCRLKLLSTFLCAAWQANDAYLISSRAKG